MPDTDTIRVGFVGAGANTVSKHIPGLRAIDGVELVSVANRSHESSQAVADKFDIPRVYDNWVDLVDSPDTDAICIGTWPYMHATLVLAALDADKHVLCEARMAMNAEEAHMMRDASREKPDLVTQIVPAPHTLAVDQTIKDLIADGYVGDVLSIDMNFSLGDFIDRESGFHWRMDRDLSGMNTMQMGIWYEILVRWIGPASSVSANSRVHVGSRKDDDGATRHLSIPDHVEIVCDMYSGPVTHMRMSMVTGLAPRESVWLFGTEGTLHLDNTTSTLSGGRRGDSKLSRIEIPKEKLGAWRVEEEFISAIRGLEPVTHTNFDDGVRYMEFTEAVLRSSQERRVIDLPL